MKKSAIVSASVVVIISAAAIIYEFLIDEVCNALSLVIAASVFIHQFICSQDMKVKRRKRHQHK